MRVHYISGYRSDKNLGLAINESVSVIDFAPDDWFVNTDHDTLFLLPDTKEQIERILLSTEYDILGCMTNRIRSTEQLIGGYFNPNDSIREHIKIAHLCQDNGRDMVRQANGCVAAFLMCFRASVWNEIGGFKENVLNFDRVFCQEAVAHGFKVGIMLGVYCWHSYRIYSDKPMLETKHLICSQEK